jgi:hypothetical protein
MREVLAPLVVFYLVVAFPGGISSDDCQCTDSCEWGCWGVPEEGNPTVCCARNGQLYCGGGVYCTVNEWWCDPGDGSYQEYREFMCFTQ